MNVAPVRTYKEPKYPVKDILDANPELLNIMPRRWQGNPAVLAALASMCLMASSVRVSADQQKKQPVQKSHVAPIFKHGNGQGSFGCISCNPPVFLSEDEARQVIVEEAKRAGIFFAADKQILQGLSVEKINTSCSITLNDVSDIKKPAITHAPDGSTRIKFTAGNAQNRLEEKPISEITLDGTDKRLNISYEYVSESDYKDWKTSYPRNLSTVSSYDLLSTARIVRSNIEAKKPQGALVVFYDPMLGRCDISNREVISFRSSIEERQAAAERNTDRVREASKIELRKQVQDFIKWLKAEGII